MRKILLILVLALLIGIVSANEAYNFQQPVDFTSHVSCIADAGATCSWVESATGGNNYVYADMPSGYVAPRNVSIISQTASPMTYSAVTMDITKIGIGISRPRVTLYDSGMHELWDDTTLDMTDGRYELKIIGGSAYWYVNGVEISHSPAPIAQNPSYVRWGINDANFYGARTTMDDVVWGSSEPLDDEASDKYVYGMPESTNNGTPYYIIMKDFINPAASGFYAGNGTLIYSDKFYSTFSKGNNNTDTINLQGYTTGVNVLSNTTGTAYIGTIQWDLASFFAASPNYGLYAMHSESSLKYSDLILYTGAGATIDWDRPSYAQGESGAILTVVLDGGYWDTTTYDYRIDVIDIYGVVDATYPVTTQTATITHTWDSDQDIGAYYAVIIAEPKDGDDDIWMAADICNVDAYLVISGYVFDAETESPINGANVNITQGIDVNNVATPADGNYTVGELAQGGSIKINVSATGYNTYLHEFIPLRVGLLNLNFTLMPTSPTYSGIALGGIAFEPPYNRTINDAYIDIQNTTNGHIYLVQTNSVGYYIQNNMVGNEWYDIWGSKTGFLNSTVYQKLVVGS